MSPGTSVKKGESVSFVISKGKKPSESDSSSSSNSGENNSNNSSSHNSDNSDNNSSNSDSNNSTSSGVTDDDDASAQSVGTMKYNIDYSKAPNDPFSLTVTLTKADGSVKTVVPTRLCFKSQKSSSVKLSGTGTCMLNVQMDKKTFTRKIKFS